MLICQSHICLCWVSHRDTVQIFMHIDVALQFTVHVLTRFWCDALSITWLHQKCQLNNSPAWFLFWVFMQQYLLPWNCLLQQVKRQRDEIHRAPGSLIDGLGPVAHSVCATTFSILSGKQMFSNKIFAEVHSNSLPLEKANEECFEAIKQATMMWNLYCLVFLFI